MTTNPSAYSPIERSGSVQIAPVATRRDRHQFFELLWPLYAQDPNWVAPLLRERLEHISPRNPYFEHAQWQAWIAMRDDKPVGRISAQVDRLHMERYQDATGFFGMLEAEDDADVFNSLLEAAENWLREQGMHRVQGPFNLSINQEAGLLVEGFDTPPSIMMGHALPYYGKRIEKQGYRKARDLLAYHIRADFTVTPLMEALRKKAEAKASLRPLNRSKLKDEFEMLRDLFKLRLREGYEAPVFRPGVVEDITQHFQFIFEF